MKAYNREDLLWEHIEVAQNPFTRFRGLMCKKELKEGEGLLIIPCNQVHTFHMRFDLDLLYLSRQNEVLHIATLAPGKVGPRVAGSHSVLEVSRGSAAKKNLETGDFILFEAMEGQRRKKL